MKRTLMTVSALLAGVVLVFGLASTAYAQKGKKAAADQDRISGTVQTINKDTSAITVRQRSTNASRVVVYSPDTKITKQNKAGGTIDEIKEGARIICVGKFDEKTRLVATRIDIR